MAIGLTLRPIARLRSSTLALVVVGSLAGVAARIGAEPVALLAASPDVPKLRMRVGERRTFSVVDEEGLLFLWALDGRALAGVGTSWTFAPAVADVGVHRLAVEAYRRGGNLRRVWVIRVEPPRPPRVVGASPEKRAITIDVDEAIELTLRTAPGDEGESIFTLWTVDGEPAGQGDTLRLRPEHPGTVRARALATGTRGAGVAREWTITVRPTAVAAVTVTTSPPTTIARPTTTTAATPPETRPPAAVTTVPTTTTPTVVARVPRTDAPTAAPPAADVDVEQFLQRYAAAWRRHDIDELRRMGQVTSEEQAAALRDYFARVEDLDVQVELLEVEPRGDRYTVRFTRRDRFRDPTGRLVSQESPPITKDVIAGPAGLRFAPRR